MMKAYIKPTMNCIDLRSEERIAGEGSCLFVHDGTGDCGYYTSPG